MAADDEPSASSSNAPTLFLSYSSEDREAARRLRDAISGHGLQVWYDEDELTGGDAWDQKIRERIRRCDYFMPLVSRSTENRREGYFRREWRQAAERTLDMADDVLFLVPVSIDPLIAENARVPERFQQVQWTRCPGGEPNADLSALCERMLHHSDGLPPPITVPTTPPTSHRSSSKKRKRAGLPPYPLQPKRVSGEPEWQHIVNLLAWGIRCAYRAFRGFPWFLRWAATMWLFFFFLRGCDGPDPVFDVDTPQITNDTVPGDAAGVRVPNLAQITRELKNSEELDSLGRFVTAFTDAAQTGRPLTLVPFTAEDSEAPTTQFSDTVFGQVWTELKNSYEGQIAVSPQSLGEDPSTADLQDRVARLDSQFLLTGWVELPPPPSEIPAETEAESSSPAPPPSARLHVVLHGRSRTTPVWSQAFPIDAADPVTVAESILTVVRNLVYEEPATKAPALVVEPPPTPAATPAESGDSGPDA